MNGRIGSLAVFMSIILLIGFGGAGNESFEEEVVLLTEDTEEKEVVIYSGEEDVILVEEEDIEDEVENVGNVSGVVEETMEVENVSVEVENVLEVLDNVSVEVEVNDSVENVSEVLDNVSVEVEEKETEYEYIDIDELIPAEEDVVEDVVRKKVLKELVKDGQVELEFKILEGDEIEIQKKEMGRGKFEKDVLISSDVHFDDEVVVYSNLPSPAREENIVVVWESENEVVTDIEYFDLDGDGLVDRISWVVPHLSSQHYSIAILVSGVDDPEAMDIGLNVNMPSNDSVVTNPIAFSLNIDYFNSSLVDCLLRIDGSIYEPFFGVGNLSYPIYLDSGLRNWEVYCSTGDNVSASAFGFFNVLDFSISGVDDFYFNGSAVSGNLNYQGDFEFTDLTLNGESIEYDANGDFVIESSLLSTLGNYELVAATDYYEEVLFASENFSVGNIDVDFNSNVDGNEVVDFVIDADGILKLLTYELHVGSTFVAASYGDQTISRGFGEGNYVVWLRNIMIGGEGYPDMSFGTLDVIDRVDEADVDVDLIFPEHEDVISDNIITFRYEVEGDDIDSCSLKLYYSETDINVFDTDELIFPLNSDDENLAIEKDLDNGEEVELKLIDFDEGYYSYEAVCTDSAGNKGWDINYFSVDMDGDSSVVDSSGEVDYDRKDEVMELIDSINSFLEKLDDFNLEERRVLEVLGLDKDMSFWKKRIVQIDQDLKFNLKFMEEAKREKRIKEIHNEIDEIREGVVLDVRSVDSYEFSKSSVDLNLIDVIGDYLEASGVSMTRSDLKSLANYNEDLQENLDVSTEAWKLELDYLEDGEKEIVLVSKNLDILSGDDNLILLEIIDGGRDAVFISEVNDMGNDIYSVDVSELESGNLVYYFDDGFALKEVENMESILFGEGVNGGISITGMFIGVGDSISSGSFLWLPLFLFFGYFGVLISGRIRLEFWKKEPGVEEMVRLINDTGILIREGKVEVAKNNYTRMGEIYKAFPHKCKDFFYDDIKRIHLAIDKKDVLGLIKEYEAAKDSFRKDDAIALHGKIDEIYRKLPRKFQEKVFRRLVKKEI